MTLPNDPGAGIIFTDGACANNGRDDAKAGCAFFHGYRASDNKELVCDFPLEKNGPTGLLGRQTSNRAELRAVIGALKFRVWPGEGFHTIVIATDSELVVEGATTWVKTWKQNGWRTCNGTPVVNRDLWELLLTTILDLAKWSGTVKFWRIPRALNTVADGAAKMACNMETPDSYSIIHGLSC